MKRVAGLACCAAIAAALWAQSGTPNQQRYRSKIMIYNLAAKSSTQIYRDDVIIEAPNWSRDGSSLIVNTGGSLYRLPVHSTRRPQLEKIDLGAGAYRCNNDHGFSRDGKLLAFSASSPSSRQSQVYLANGDGSGAKLMTPAAPSYFHGWSPDGKWIYFNSERSGGWDIWRMPADGAGADDARAERVTSDEWEDWFPHFSPDGKWLLVFSFPHGAANHNGKMPGVALRLMPAPGKTLKPAKLDILTEFFGGQGTINVNSWSPDSKKFAYVIYEPVA